MIETREFGASLRRERERRGISLDVIAEQTKVSASLLAGLEHGDLSRWPTGIFRRAFVRSYAQAIGVDVEDTLSEFLRVFPDDGGPIRPRSGGNTHALRLTFDQGSWVRPDRRNVVGLGIDAAAIIIVAVAAAWSMGTSRWGLLLVAAAAILWHAGGVIAWGSSPGAWLARRRNVARAAESQAAQAVSAVEVVDERQPASLREGSRLPSPPPPPSRIRVQRRERRRPDRSSGSDGRVQ